MFKTGFKQIVLNSDPGFQGVTVATGALTGIAPATGTGIQIPGFATITAAWGTVMSAGVVEGVVSTGTVATLGQGVVDISMPSAEVGDIIDVKIFMTAEAVRFLPEMFSYEEIKLVSAQVSDPTKLAEDLQAVIGGIVPDEFFSQNLFTLSGTGNVLTLDFKKGYEGYSFSRVEVTIANKVNSVPSGTTTSKMILSSNPLFTTNIPGTLGINTGKEIETDVRNGFFENIDPYGVHFGGNDQGVDVRGLYNAYIFKTLDDQEKGWEPHAGLGYGDANTDTTYVARDYIVYALQGSSADDAMALWAL